MEAAENLQNQLRERIEEHNDKSRDLEEARQARNTVEQQRQSLINRLQFQSSRLADVTESIKAHAQEVKAAKAEVQQISDDIEMAGALFDAADSAEKKNAAEQRLAALMQTAHAKANDFQNATNGSAKF